MIKSDLKLFKMIRRYLKWFRMIRNDSKWFKTIQNGSKRFENDFKWCITIWNASKWFEMIKNDSENCVRKFDYFSMKVIRKPFLDYFLLSYDPIMFIPLLLTRRLISTPNPGVAWRLVFKSTKWGWLLQSSLSSGLWM